MTKEELKEYRYTKNELKQVREQLNKLVEEKKTFIKSPTFSDMPKGSNSCNEIENILIKIEEAEEKYRSLYLKLINLQINIEEVICKLKTNERILMRYRYIECKNWEEITVLMKYSWKQIHRIHSNILIKIA